PDTEIVNPVPLLIGANADEMLMYLDAEDPTPFASALTSYAPAKTPWRKAIAAYFEGSEGDTLEKANALTSAAEFFCPALDLARQLASNNIPVFFYYFTRTRPGGESLGAYHGAEIPYVFDTEDTWLPANDVDLSLTAAMQGYWLNFAANGDPNGGDRVVWKPMGISGLNIQELGDVVGPTSDHPAEACALFSTSS
ncbi:MAG: carboxylesterase family protein, partial [Pseudomonadota bacterium]